MPQRPSHSSRFSLAIVLLLFVVQAIAAGQPSRFSGGGALSRATQGSDEGRFLIYARLQTSGVLPTPSKQVGPQNSAIPASDGHFALSATLSRRDFTSQGALTCDLADDIFNSGFE